VSVCIDQWNIDEVFAEEPHLHFIAAKHTADEHVVSTVIIQERRPTSELPSLCNHFGVCFEQSGD
jgi:hypothetical protein